ncbi:hypothetical protein DOE78_18800 [Bacillus sp. Y1]|nr:phage tail protein [Bacillus sp. Y1]AYA77333.1 hypothetical protein DOE78_18800 [Bacillus sp. Y1]
MLIITDIHGNTEGLTGYTKLKRYRNVSGEKSLAFLVLPTEQNAHSFGMVTEESIVEFAGESYRIKQLAEKSKGRTFYKEVVAIHTFFDLIDEHVYDLHNGSLTFANALNFALGGSGYTWSIVDTFLAQDFENFGDSNRLALFQTILERYGAEFTLSGTHITLRKRIGNATDFQFRYNYNVKTLARDVNTNNLSTYIKGYGKQNEDGTYVVQSEYTSPNAAIFGTRHAKPVRDERYTTLEGLNDRLVAELNDTPEVSITIDFADMRRAGYPYDVPNEGDDVFLIYEPIGIDVEARIVEVDEEFTEASDLPISTSVTLANIRESVIQRMVNTEKTVRNIVGSDGRVRFNVLDAWVQRATQALQSAQTELEFENGIIARSKTNPNHLVLLNSAGIGISSDGGQTFREAITSDGFVLSAGAIGQLEANNIQISAATTFAQGYDPTTKETPDGAMAKANSAGQAVRNDLRQTAPLPTSITMNQDGITASTSDASRYARLDYRGLYVNNGAVQIKRDDGYMTVIDGKLNQGFDIQGGNPPQLVDSFIEGRFFATNSMDTNGATCDIYTFTRQARYVVFQVAVMSEVDTAQSRVIVTQSGNDSVWLGGVSGFSTTEEVKSFYIDLGTPDGTAYAFRLRLKTYQSNSKAFCRVIRLYQTDFLPSGV